MISCGESEKRTAASGWLALLQTLTVGLRNTQARLCESGPQPAFGGIGIEKRLRGIQTAAKDKHNARHDCQVPQRQAHAYARSHRDAQILQRRHSTSPGGVCQR